MILIPHETIMSVDGDVSNIAKKPVVIASQSTEAPVVIKA